MRETFEMKITDRYEPLDGLRAYAAIGIVLMHVLANGGYQLQGLVFEKLIPSFTDLVFLFMMISSFSLCCGYYDRIIKQEVSVEQFYRKRYQKIWPYFAVLCMLDFCVSPSLQSLYEVFANLTLCFGLLPNANIEVIGVGWFLGLIFAFYLVFPFVCFLLAKKPRAWAAFGVAYGYNVLCQIYFTEADRTNIVFSAVYLLAGGMIFLYRDKLLQVSQKHRLLLLALCAGAACLYYLTGAGTETVLALNSLILIASLGAKSRGWLVNPITKFISGISMEIYLSHMVIYRILEKAGLTRLFSSEAVSYLFAVTGTVLGSIVFAWLLQQGIRKVQLVAGKILKKDQH